VPAPQPAQVEEVASDEPAGVSGGSHTSGAQLSSPTGCCPSSQACGTTMHCASSSAPSVSVDVPGGQERQDALEVPPRVGEKVPSGHRAHARAAAPAEKEPAGQVSQVVAPAVLEKKPGAQGAHADAAEAPSPGLNRPLGQGVHPSSVCPGAGLYEPEAQAEQLAAAVAPRAFPKKPGAQGVHAEAEARPTTADQEPAGQGTHAPPCPALLQVPGGQGAHVEGDVAPATGEKVPPAQGVQEKGEVAAEDVP